MTRATVRRVAMDRLQDFAEAALVAAGMSDEDARILSRALVEADATGVATHGLNRLPAYIRQLQTGQVNPRPTEQVRTDEPCSLLVDAGGGFGAPVGVRTIDALTGKAAATGVAVGGVTRVAHFGTAAFYTRRAAEAGFLALAMSSTSPSVVPFGGRSPRIGNSPMSFAAPGTDGPELLLDMAQSMSSRGRIRMAMDAGEAIPTDWALDADGEPTSDPTAALAGGVLPSGGHKGSALSLMVEMLASGLTGANLSQHINHAGFTSAPGTSPSSTTDVTVGNFYLVIDADIFGDAMGVRRRASAVADHVRASDPAPGRSSVLAPGDPEAASLQRVAEDGVELQEQTLRSLHEIAETLSLPPLFGQPAAPHEES